MKLIAGLGNPGPRYQKTRHNVGYRVVDELARRWNVSIEKFDRDFEALCGEAYPHGTRTLLLKPQTYMNLSGRSVRAAQRFYKIDLGDLLIVIDDLALVIGRVRLRATGSGGGQKGLENVLLQLASNDIARLRIGIDAPRFADATAHVLGRFTPDEMETIDAAVSTAADAVECWIEHGIEEAMTRFNRRG